jgi:hypothetical protein
MTAIQEDILTSQNLIASGKMLDALLSSVLKDKSIDPSQFTLGDRNAIVIWLRATGYGADYPVMVHCTSCDTEWKKEFDLSSLEIRELEEDPDQEGYFTINLPQTKSVVKFKFITAADEMGIIKKSEAIQRKQGSPVDHTGTLKMTAAIVEVNGSRDPLTIKSFVETMPVKDSRKFRDTLNSMEPGVIMKQECECPACGSVSTEVIPMRSNFFWPDTGV